jgi:hypothetical protein
VPPYVHTRARDPQTGDVLMNGATWAFADAPMVHVVLRVLRTPLGTYLPDPTFGVDYSVIQKRDPGVGARWRAAVLRGLQYLVDLRRITDVRVEYEVVGAQLRYAVSFVDPQIPGVRQSTKRLVV